MKTFLVMVLLGLLSLGPAATSNAADQILDRGHLHEILPYGPLDGTIWMSTASRERLRNDHPGKAARENGTEISIYILASFEFLTPRERVYSVKIDDWSRGANSHVSNSATLVSNGENNFILTEHSPRPLSNFSGTKGHGLFRVIGKDTAELTDVRRLSDGSAHTSVTTLHRVDPNLGSRAHQIRPSAQ